MEERDLNSKVLRLTWRLDAIDHWRDEITNRVAVNTRELERLVKADEIAEAVSERLKQERTIQFTFVQKALATVVAALALAGTVKGLFW